MPVHSIPPRTRRGARLAFLLAAAPAIGWLLAADAPPSAPPPVRTPVIEKVSSELVLIETYATDGLGRPVTDLTRD
ncbi:MAG TPA: hypothetical protein VJV75_08960, partial [Candidatus Polarisedimenticolia bacterium]|nr:hypothetical protein [Candidatus Polarisedimenticolia bacterium]